jgi:hypothetical protein
VSKASTVFNGPLEFKNDPGSFKEEIGFTWRSLSSFLNMVGVRLDIGTITLILYLIDKRCKIKSI